MSPSKKSAKKQRPLPPQVDFETWLQQLARCIAPRSREATTLQGWAERRAAYYTFLGETEQASAESLLKHVFVMTRPQLTSGVEKKKHEAVARQLKGLLPELVSALGAIKACNSLVVPEDGIPPLDLSQITVHLEEAAPLIRGALLHLDRPYRRSGDVLSHCWLFIGELENSTTSEMDALSLCRLLMKAHGFSDDELEVFSKRSREAGTVRKRRHAAGNKLFDTVEAYLELMRKHKNIPPFNPALYRQKKN